MGQMSGEVEGGGNYTSRKNHQQKNTERGETNSESRQEERREKNRIPCVGRTLRIVAADGGLCIGNSVQSIQVD